MKAATALWLIKFAHTIAWAFFVACILLLPVAAYQGHFRSAGWLIAAVTVELVILMLNGWACPLTAVAARHTSERQANFDIFLPLWLARSNKEIFGWLFVAGLVYTVLQWWRHLGST